jgi:hypothetical protein
MNKLFAWLLPIKSIRLTPDTVYWLPGRLAAVVTWQIPIGAGMSIPAAWAAHDPHWLTAPHPYGEMTRPWPEEG